MSDYVNMNTLKFLVKYVFESKKLCELNRFSDYDSDAFDILLDSNKSFSDKYLKPFYKEMDKNPAHFKDGKIIVHPSVEKVMRAAGENGSIGATFDYNDGGMQLPHLIHQANGHIAGCANNGAIGYAGLTEGAANLIVTFGSDDLKKKFIPKMINGDWGGTMCLTEPQAGSSLSDIVTSATKLDDNCFSIKGDKIFISGGDHKYCENFVHLVLARIDGAPKGTKGISLFAVPKNLFDSEQITNSNNVSTIGDFQKLGEKGFCTTHLAFGEKGVSKGWLVGEENKGLAHMFQMMNGARIDVGMKGASLSTAAYLSSLEYALNRPQGRRIKGSGNKNIQENQALITEHPDVRRMLLFQESISEGALSLVLQCSLYHDFSNACESKESRDKYHDLLELLTPIAKTFPAEKGLESISNGLQVLGGYGFCTDYDLEQYYRDIRIMSIYEGTTGIQSLDLMGRKIIMKNGAAMKLLIEEFKETIHSALNYDELKPYAEHFKTNSKELGEVIMKLLGFAMKGDHERYISDATIFMEYMSTIVVAWQWLKMATVAKTLLVSGNNTYSKEFYEKKIHTMKFYFKYELSRTNGIKNILLHPESLTIIEKEEKVFI